MSTDRDLCFEWGEAAEGASEERRGARGRPCDREDKRLREDEPFSAVRCHQRQRTLSPTPHEHQEVCKLAVTMHVGKLRCCVSLRALSARCSQGRTGESSATDMVASAP
uniref:Uncharacterized protein n=1 Tax=Hanusia phi TaxID=3032 RepID=A0A6T7QML1_9CRYP|mmetsp:Transcript_2563/g.6155  ORF Transcript_2563/g.6155 Transcript_2563/m.6155 type:complete len:109 (+) Transcript_2563:638-964(+)